MWTRPDFDLLNDPPTPDFSRQHELEAFTASELQPVDPIHAHIDGDLVLTSNAVLSARSDVANLTSLLSSIVPDLRALGHACNPTELDPFLSQSFDQDSEISGAAGDIGDVLGSVS